MSDSRQLVFASNRIHPPGTRVVINRQARAEMDQTDHLSDSVGVIIRSPVDSTHKYRIRLVHGAEVSLASDEFDLLKHVQNAGLEYPAGQIIELEKHVIYECIVGSRAFGLSHDESDVDRRGIYLPPAEMQWSLYGYPEQLESDATQECYWELRKFLVLALKANPNVLECLYTPLVERAAPIAIELLAIRVCFLSKLIYQTYNGYVISQFKKLEQDLRSRNEIRWKHAMHLIRLLLGGIHALREGDIKVDAGEHREMLLEIRNGSKSWDDVEAFRKQLHREFDEAYARTALPDRPDYERANELLIKARRSML